jgi:hypothetical protein
LGKNILARGYDDAVHRAVKGSEGQIICHPSDWQHVIGMEASYSRCRSAHRDNAQSGSAAQNLWKGSFKQVPSFPGIIDAPECAEEDEWLGGWESK